LLGAAAGGFTGHKVGGGPLGTIVGALGGSVVGSKFQNSKKKKKKEKHEKKKYKHRGGGGSGSDSGSGSGSGSD